MYTYCYRWFGVWRTTWTPSGAKGKSSQIMMYSRLPYILPFSGGDAKGCVFGFRSSPNKSSLQPPKYKFTSTLIAFVRTTKMCHWAPITCRCRCIVPFQNSISWSFEVFCYTHGHVIVIYSWVEGIERRLRKSGIRNLLQPVSQQCFASKRTIAHP